MYNDMHMHNGDAGLFTTTDEQDFLKFAGETGQGYYVPAYQRYYVWKEPDIDRFFLDIANGMSELFAGRQDVTFIGTLTCFYDVKYVTIEPKVRLDVPPSVINIVDGQQRITTLMLASMLLHDYIRVQSSKCSSEWLRESITMDHLNRLNRTFETVKDSGEMRHYPKMIRAYDDVWSVDPNKLKYTSPLANLIFHYGQHFRNAKGKYHFKPEIPVTNPDQIKVHENFLKLVKSMRSYISNICDNGVFKGKSEDSEDEVYIPAVKDFVLKEKIVTDICNVEVLPDDKNVDIEDSDQQKLLRAFYLASYILNRIHFVALIAPQEKQVYDIFDALNTTGQTLTALETFKPEVILFEGIKDFVDSPCQNEYNKIEQFVGSLSTTDKMKKVSNEIVIGFAYAEDGTRLSRHLGNQRSYLRNGFSRENDKETGKKYGREYVEHLSSVSQITQHYWYDTGDNLLSILPISDELRPELSRVQFCLKYLKAANHGICRPLISRFHFQAMKYRNEGDKYCKELFDVIKATAAFFALWRSSRKHTDSIDDWYRALYSDGKLPEKNTISPINRQKTMDSSAILSSAEIKRAFRSILTLNDIGAKVKIPDCEIYKENVFFVPIYRTQKATAKFLLMIATHNAVPSKDIPGIVEDGREGVNPVLTGEKWDDPNFHTLEHIIPQSRANEKGIDPGLEAEMLDRLGNLTLLPKKVNSIISDHAWETRRIFYEAVTANTHDESTVILKEIEPPISDDMIEQIAGLNISKILAALVLIEDFGKDHIEPRSNNISERAWKMLYEDWLDGSDD